MADRRRSRGAKKTSSGGSARVSERGKGGERKSAPMNSRGCRPLGSRQAGAGAAGALPKRALVKQYMPTSVEVSMQVTLLEISIRTFKYKTILLRSNNILSGLYIMNSISLLERCTSYREFLLHCCLVFQLGPLAMPRNF